MRLQRSSPVTLACLVLSCLLGQPAPIAAELALVGVDGTKRVIADNVMARSILFGPQRASLVNVSVRMLTHEDLARACAAYLASDMVTAAEVLSYDVLVVPLGGDYSCNGGLLPYKASSFEFYCQFSRALVRTDSRKGLGIWAMIHFDESGPTECIHAVAHPLDDAQDDGLFAGEQEFTGLTGDLILEENPHVPVLQSSGVQFVARGVITAMYLGLSARACQVYLLRRRTRRMPIIPRTVLSIAAVSMFLLGIVQALGAHYFSSITPVPIVVLTFGELSGATSSLDILLAANYFKVCNGAQAGHEGKSRVAPEGVVKYAIWFSLSILGVEAAQCIAYIVSTSPLTLLFSERLFPAFISLVQITVTVILVRQQRKASVFLREFAGSGKAPINTTFLRLERHLRYWVRVSILATCVQCIPSVTMSTGMAMNYGVGFWLFNLFLFKLSKVGNTLAQINTFAPMSQARVYATGASQTATASHTSAGNSAIAPPASSSTPHGLHGS